MGSSPLHRLGTIPPLKTPTNRTLRDLKKTESPPHLTNLGWGRKPKPVWGLDRKLEQAVIYHQKVAVPFSTVRGIIFWNLRQPALPSSMPILSPVGILLEFRWDVRERMPA